jgi:hypothetical protein
MQNISYVAGNQYCILSITKREAQKYGIENSDNVEIKALQDGIVIKRKSTASTASTSGFTDSSDIKSHHQTGIDADG